MFYDKYNYHKGMFKVTLLANYYWTQITLKKALIMHKFMQIFPSGSFQAIRETTKITSITGQKSKTSRFSKPMIMITTSSLHTVLI